jgi:hypothetical protein
LRRLCRLVRFGIAALYSLCRLVRFGIAALYSLCRLVRFGIAALYSLCLFLSATPCSLCLLRGDLRRPGRGRGGPPLPAGHLFLYFQRIPDFFNIIVLYSTHVTLHSHTHLLHLFLQNLAVHSEFFCQFKDPNLSHNITPTIQVFGIQCPEFRIP